MGKRSKSETKACDDVETNRKVRKVNYVTNPDAEESEPKTDLSQISIKKVKNKRTKLNTETVQTETLIESTLIDTKNDIDPVNKTKKSKKKNKAQTLNSQDLSNETAEVPVSSKKKKKNNELSQEDDVKDEDIDKFCDELTEEDNEQYEDWVKLIESALSTNKKKPK